MDMDMMMYEEKDERHMTYLEDFIGAIPTFLSIYAGVLNYNAYVDGTSSTDWQTAYKAELLYSGIVESSAIALVFITDSQLIRAIGAISMVGINAAGLYLVDQAEQASTSTSYASTTVL